MASRAPQTFPRISPRGVIKPARPILDLRHPLSGGLVSYWPLGNGALGFADDLSPNNNTGTFVSSPAWSHSHHGGRAIALNGSTQYINCGHAAILSFSSGGGADKPFAISAWIYPTTISSSFNSVLGKYNQGVAVEYMLGFNDTIIAVNTYLANASAYIGRTAPFASATYLNKWTHVAATYDASKANSGFAIYINGVKADNGNLSSGAYTGMTASSQPVFIGARLNSSVVEFPFTGNIDATRLYGRVPTASEIARLYAEPYAGILDAARPMFRGGAAAAGGTTLSRYYFAQHIARAA